jgi:cyclophilin family peptidyl-prolyl cis-trans isomerase
VAPTMRVLLAAPALLLLAAALSGCTADDNGTNGTRGGGLVENACTEHPNYGTGNPRVRLETSMGNITAEIFVDKAPNTGMNFVKLAEAGTLEGSPFHRIISNFMMQGGDYTDRNGTGGSAHPDCADADGNIPDEYSPDLRHDGKGVLSMANRGPGTGSSQFFITFAATSWLDGYDAQGTKKNCGGFQVSCHAVFGKVVEGMDVLDKVNQQAGSQSGTPRTPVTLLNTTVEWP